MGGGPWSYATWSPWLCSLLSPLKKGLETRALGPEDGTLPCRLANYPIQRSLLKETNKVSIHLFCLYSFNIPLGAPSLHQAQLWGHQLPLRGPCTDSPPELDGVVITQASPDLCQQHQEAALNRHQGGRGCPA